MAVTAELSGKQATGFANPVSSSQAVFRQVMNALARPGSIQTIPDDAGALSHLMPASAAIALTLFDQDTPVWIDSGFEDNSDTAAWLRFHTGAPLTTDASMASFALIHSGSTLPDFADFARGSAEYPDRSTTLVIQVDTLTEGPEFLLTGPGIRATSMVRAALPSDFVARMQDNRAQFPRGVDLLLVCGAQLVALPRSTHIAVMEA